MVRVLWVLVVLAALWCGWWAIAAFGFSSSVQAWFEDRRADGWKAELADVSTGGFPTKVTANLDAITLADTKNALAVSMDSLQMSFRALWPGDMWVNAPQTPIQFATPQGQWALNLIDGQADMNLHPGSRLELENLSFVATGMDISDPGGTALLASGPAKLALLQQDVATTYALTFDAESFLPGQGIRDVLRLGADLPATFDTLTADLMVDFDAPIDRATLEDQRPQPRSVTANRVEAKWGNMRLLATGQAVRDVRGYAEGDVTIKAENWQQMLDVAVAAGVLPGQYRSQAESLIGSFASGTGKTNSLDMTLQFKNGLTRFGFFPIGPAPRMVIR